MKTVQELRMKILEPYQRRRASVFIFNCEHISNLVLIVDIEQANVCWVHIGKTNFWRQDQVYHALCCNMLNMNETY